MKSANETAFATHFTSIFSDIQQVKTKFYSYFDIFSILSNDLCSLETTTH